MLFSPRNIRLAALSLLLVLASSPCFAADGKIGVLVGREIRPFIEMVEGLEARLAMPVVRHFLDAGGRPYSLAPGAAPLTSGRYELLVAVGPGALSYLAAQAPAAARLVYGMVADPEALAGNRSGLCGVELAIDLDAQFAAIRRKMPAAARLGVLHNPAVNSAWFQAASPIAARHRLRLVPLPVGVRSEVDAAVAGAVGRIDAFLFIPDPTVSSRPVIEFVIRQGLKMRIPVIGYNQYFHESGAALSFALNYRALGEQTAGLVQALLAGGLCPERSAPYDILVNEQVFRLLGKTGGPP